MSGRLHNPSFTCTFVVSVGRSPSLSKNFFKNFWRKMIVGFNVSIVRDDTFSQQFWKCICPIIACPIKARSPVKNLSCYWGACCGASKSTDNIRFEILKLPPSLFFFFNAHIWLNLYQDIEYLTSFFTKIAFVLKCTLPYLIVRKGGKDWGSKFHFWTNFTTHFTMLWLHFYKSLTQKRPSPFPRI